LPRSPPGVNTRSGATAHFRAMCFATSLQMLPPVCEPPLSNSTKRAPELALAGPAHATIQGARRASVRLRNGSQHQSNATSLPAAAPDSTTVPSSGCAKGPMGDSERPQNGLPGESTQPQDFLQVRPASMMLCADEVFGRDRAERRGRGNVPSSFSVALDWAPSPRRRRLSVRCFSCIRARRWSVVLALAAFLALAVDARLRHSTVRRRFVQPASELLNADGRST